MRFAVLMGCMREWGRMWWSTRQQKRTNTHCDFSWLSPPYLWEKFFLIYFLKYSRPEWLQPPQQDSKATAKWVWGHQKLAQAFNKLAKSLGTTQLTGERKTEIEGKCQGCASGHSLLTPSFLCASSKHHLISHRTYHVLQPLSPAVCMLLAPA